MVSGALANVEGDRCRLVSRRGHVFKQTLSDACALEWPHPECERFFGTNLLLSRTWPRRCARLRRSTACASDSPASGRQGFEAATWFAPAGTAAKDACWPR